MVAPIADFQGSKPVVKEGAPIRVLVCVCCGALATSASCWYGLRYDLCDACEGATLVARLTSEKHEVKLRSGYRFDAKERKLIILCPMHGERDHDAPFNKQTLLF